MSIDKSTWKKQIRSRALATRDALTLDERREKERQILRRLKEIPLGAHVFVYKSMRSEVSTEHILEWLHEIGATVYLPRTNQENVSMAPHPYAPGDPLERKQFGMLEPLGEPLEDLAKLTAILVPLVAFDDKMDRIGYGAGFYDRFLPLAPHAKRIGLAFSVQKVTNFEHEATDVPLDMIVTEDEVFENEYFTRGTRY